MKIFLEFKTVSVTISGDYYQVLFTMIWTQKMSPIS